MNRLYSILDPGHLGAGLQSQMAGMQLTCITAALDAHRMARGTQPQSANRSIIETMIYGTAALDGGEYVGAVTAAAPTNKYVGEDANGVGYRYFDGKVYINGAVVATFATAAKGDFVYILLDLDSTTPTLTVIKNQTVLGVVNLTAGLTWYPAYTLSGGAALGKYLFMNSGARDFQFVQTASDGWWSAPATPAPILLATLPYLTQSTDSLPNTRFDAVDGRIEISESFVIPSGVSFWVDGSGASIAASLGTVDLEDPEGTYDYLLDYRNADVSIASVIGDTTSFDTAVNEGNLILDRAETQGDQKKRLYLTDPIAALLDLPFQRSFFPPNVDANVANTPRPVSLGGPRNFTPVLYDAANRKYAFADRVIGYLGTLRDPKVMVFGTDFVFTADLMGVQLLADPPGHFTAELSSVLAGPGATPVDVLAGAGLFNTFTTNADVDANWYRHILAPSMLVPVLITSAGYGQVKMPHDGEGYIKTLLSKTNVILNGKSYQVVIEIDAFPFVTLTAYNTPDHSYFWIDGQELGIWSQYAWSGAYYSEYPTASGGLNFHAPGTLTINFSNTQGSDKPLALRWFANNGLDDFLLKSVKLYQLPDASTNTPLTGLTLEQYMREVLTRAGWNESQWAAEDARAIDAATGYQISNGFYNGIVTVRAALQPALDSFGAGIFRRRDGRLGVTRLIDPDSVADADIDGTIELVDILEEPQGTLYEAKGLRTDAKGRRNFSPFSDSDFANFTTADISLFMRKELELDYQFTVSGLVQLDPAYQQSAGADARTTLFDREADAQPEQDRVGGIFTRARKTFQIMVSAPPGNTLEVGNVRKLSYGKYVNGVFVPRYGMDGAKVYLLQVDRFPALQKARLTVFR